jgi:hypothetical protein
VQSFALIPLSLFPIYILYISFLENYDCLVESFLILVLESFKLSAGSRDGTSSFHHIDEGRIQSLHNIISLMRRAAAFISVCHGQLLSLAIVHVTLSIFRGQITTRNHTVLGKYC